MATTRLDSGPEGRTPYDLDAERAVLGSILIDPAAISDVMETLRPEHFYRKAHGLIYSAMLTIYERGDAPDVVMVAAELNSYLDEAGGSGYLAELPSAAPTSINAKQYARIVADRAQSRSVIFAAGKIAQSGYEGGTLEDARTTLASIADEMSSAGVTVNLEKLGPTYRATVTPPDLRVLFRDIKTDGELSADVSIAHGDKHLFRTTTTLSVTTRDRLSKTAAEMAGANGAAPMWRTAMFAAVEAVLEAEESLGGGTDLRGAILDSTANLFVIRPIWEDCPTVLVGPGESGKSVLARALAISAVTGLEIVPGMVPVTIGPILYCAGEDAVAMWHARSVESICRGVGIDRTTLPHPITLLNASGKPIHRIARAIAERANDFVGVIIDPLSAFLAAGDQVRDRDTIFWRSIDQIERPTLILAHPNRAESRNWVEADGRIAGSEIHRDRMRLAWAYQWRDELATFGSSFRRYTVENTKRNHGPRWPALAFSVSWEFGMDDQDPGTVRFLKSEPFGRPVAKDRPLSSELSAALEAYEAGAKTPAVVAQMLDISNNTAKSRLRLLKERGLISGPTLEN